MAKNSKKTKEEEIIELYKNIEAGYSLRAIRYTKKRN